MSRSVLVDPELIGLRAAAGRIRPVAPVPFALLSVGVALAPITQPVLWAAAVIGCNVVPWLLGLRRVRPGGWRLSDAGLERYDGTGAVAEAYRRDRIEEFAITADDGVLTVFHKFGRTDVGTLAELGFDELGFYMTARRLGIVTHVVDGDRTVFDDEERPTDDELPRAALSRHAERRLRDQEAALLAVVHEPHPAAESGTARLGTDRTGRRRTAWLGVLGALLAVTMITRIAVDGGLELGARLMGGLWALLGVVAVLGARRRRLGSTPLEWTITPDAVTVRHARAGEWHLPAEKVAAAVAGPGLEIDPADGRPVDSPLVVTVFGHDLDVLARLPAGGLDAFQLTHALDERGYRIVTPEQGVARPSEYGLAGLPEIFARVPGGRLVVDGDGVGWADGAGDVVLRMPRDRIGGIELLTVDGHAWLRMYDDDGDEFLAAPLSLLRISRTDLRESARRALLPVTDAEYDAYVSASFHGSITELAEPLPIADRDPLPPTLLDVPGRTRALTYAVTVVMCEVVAVLGALWLRGDLGGYWTALAWSAPAAAFLGAAGAWLYDRNRSQLSIAATGVTSVTRTGRTEWDITREAIGGMGIDESETPRLVLWSPTGRILRRVTFPPDLTQLRQACERHGLPWGPPDAHHPAAPPPEL